MLASNPIFASNPKCLGDFVSALVQPDIQKMASPTASEPAPPAVDSVAPTLVVPSDSQSAEDKAIESRKMFWAKFKRPSKPDFQKDLEDSLLSLPTLILGDDPNANMPAATPPAPEPLPVPMQESAVGTLQPLQPSVAEVPPAREALPVPTQESVVGTPAMAEVVVPPSDSLAVDTPVDGLDVSDEVDAMRSWFLKMDDVELAREEKKVRASPHFTKFCKEEGLKSIKDWGTFDLAEELAGFYLWLDAHPSDAAKVLAPQENGTAQPAPMEEEIPVPEPMKAAPQEPAAPTEPALPDTPVPPPAKGDSSVAAALKRLQTVDLEQGNRPPQTLSSLADERVPVRTIVLMSLQGIEQPVALPLTPEQCVAAGLKLANAHMVPSTAAGNDAADRQNNNEPNTAPVPTGDVQNASAGDAPHDEDDKDGILWYNQLVDLFSTSSFKHARIHAIYDLLYTISDFCCRIWIARIPNRC